MANLLQRITRRTAGVEISEPVRYGMDDYVQMLNQWHYAGGSYSYGGYSQTLADGGTEKAADPSSIGAAAYNSNGVVFACELVRMLVLSGIRFTYQRYRRGAPSDIWGDSSLRLLERPFGPGSTTQALIVRMVQDADLMGSAYIAQDTPLARLGGSDPDPELVRLDPMGVQIVLDPIRRDGVNIGYRKLGYLYSEYGSGSGDVAAFLPDEVAQWSPLPDPMARYRGMSWLTPVLREIEADRLMEVHRGKFFQNGATPNIIVKHAPEVGPEEARAFKDLLDAQHGGVDNAYKTLHLGGGADLSVVGRDMQQVNFSVVQGHGETRVAAAAGVPPVIVGLSEGLQAATYSNYGQARRRFADGTCHPLWSDMAGSLEILTPVPADSRLWYDARGVPFLREDEKDAAEIFSQKAGAIQTLTNTGFEPDAVIAAVDSGDVRMLSGKHSGLLSVQLQEPGTGNPGAEPGVTDPSTNDTPAPGGNSNGN